MNIVVGARSSPLSRTQVAEVAKEISLFHPEVIFEPIWADSPGDRDKKTSLRSLGKDDFFTRDLDEMLLQKKIRIAIHSGKDLPEPLRKGLAIVALTKGVDSRDVLVFREGESLESLTRGAKIATSSARREEKVKQMRSDLTFVDLRGTIGERLNVLERKEIDGIVIAEAALIRLQMTHLNRIFLDGESAPSQGRLAIVARADDLEMKALFQKIHFRKILYLGLDPKEGTFHPLRGDPALKGRVFQNTDGAEFEARPQPHAIPGLKAWVHYPVIRVERIESERLQEALKRQEEFTHFIITSKNAVRLWPGNFSGKTVIAVGKATAKEASFRGARTLVAEEERQEGVAKLIETLDNKSPLFFLYVRSKRARPFLEEFLRKKNIPSYILDLYDTILQKPEPVPNLHEFDEIVFTSPSTIEGFSRIFSQVPKRISFTCIGPITEKALEEYSFARI